MAGRCSPAEQDEIWARWRRGEALRTIARHFGTDMANVRRFLMRTGGRRLPARRRAEGQLSAAEREEVSRGVAAGESCRVTPLGGRHGAQRAAARDAGLAPPG